MNASLTAPCAVQSPKSPQGPVPKTSPAGTPTGSETALKKRKKLLNGVNIKLTFPSGATYDGSFKDGRMEGYGVYVYARTGDVYRGEWKADLKHGYGRYTFANGDKYVGQWYMGNRHGKGQFAFANGDEYVGSWRENQMNGYGVFLLASSCDRYEGYWEEGVRHGQGSLYYGNGDLYDGEWCSGHQQGLGVFRQSNDDLYCGQWEDGVMDGKGILREKGILFLVEYVEGYLISKERQSEALDATEHEWAPAYRHFLAWSEHHEGQSAPSQFTSKESRLGDELESALAENSALRKRLEDALALHRPRGGSRSAVSELHSASDSAALEKTAAQYWKELFLEVKGKVKLLECTLAERVVEARKLASRLKSSDARVHELELESAARKARFRNAKHNGAHESFLGEAVTLDAQPTHPEGDISEDDEAAELKEQNALLARRSEELRQKAAFLAVENARLAVKAEAAEDQYDKLAEELAEMRMGLENGQRTGVNSQQLQAGGRAAIATASHSTPVSASSPVPLLLASQGTCKCDELEQKLLQANQLNIELQLRIGKWEREAEARTSDAGLPPAQDTAALIRENGILRSLIVSLKAELALMQSASEDAEQEIFLFHQREIKLEERMKAIAHRKAADPQLQTALELKSERAEKLELENAELARLLEEARVDLEEKAAVSASVKRQPHAELPGAGRAPNELVSAQKELKKLQMRMKRVTGERNSVTEQLYESQVRLTRRGRALEALQGRIIVFTAVADGGSGSLVVSDVTLRVDAADPRKLQLNDCGEDTVHQYDYCFEKDASVEQVFAELCDPLALVWSGYQFALMTVGEFRSGKTGLVKEILPLLMKHLSTTAEESPKRSFFSFTYRVAVVEISSRGGFDCASGKDVTEVYCDANGFVKPKNARFIDCTSGSIPNVVDNLLAKRRQHHNGRSHTWIQLQCVRTSAVRQCQTVGRLTIFDWCGGGPVASQKTDIESARFANASSYVLRDLATALASKLPMIPYTKSIEASLLFDLLGGNSLTTVVGRVRPSAEHVEETLRTLAVLTSLFGVRNGPLLPDTQTSDEVRWRSIVTALCSDDQAERELKPVENMREL
ncbi:hypothetical protein LSCM1_01583 [Leishmania martiniquensis]|uniref:Kinesin motor domain-containing protein n=1 Tax=Leishmania martiniquensis TaxID=1580590 RepID=A0A836H5T3_9TRYP|nr:hypothetical protein LSCM1_01583 [Leishmania martiniquensis]